MRRYVIAALALVGCKEQNPDFCPAHPEDPRCGGAIDGGVDGKTIDAQTDAGPSCFGGGAFEVCPLGAATGSKTLSGTLDTTTSNLCSTTQYWKSTGQTTSCFIVAANVTIQNVSVTGARPLVVIASNELTITGHLDAASHIATTTPIEGPGAVNPGTCGTFGAPTDQVSPAGGGAGASFELDGGGGGNGGKGGVTNNGGTAYAPFLATPPGTLRGGCGGQQGAQGQGGTGGGGGYGGGAVYLVAGGTMSLGASAIINASGAGAAVAGKNSGGGGGGSGGMIILQANDYAITNGAIVVANGGSGSTGGDGNGAGTGTRGNDPDPTSPMTPAPGPTGTGAAGGGGFAGASQAGNGGNGGAAQGGGGGGGGGGYIQSNKALTNAKLSPPANVVVQ